MRGGRGSTACCPSVQKCKLACGLCKGGEGRVLSIEYRERRASGGGWRPQVAGGGKILRSRVSAIRCRVQVLRFRCRYWVIHFLTAIR